MKNKTTNGFPLLDLSKEDKINLIIGEDTRRQLEYLKKEMGLESDGELIKEALLITFNIVKKVKKG